MLDWDYEHSLRKRGFELEIEDQDKCESPSQREGSVSHTISILTFDFQLKLFFVDGVHRLDPTLVRSGVFRPESDEPEIKPEVLRQ